MLCCIKILSQKQIEYSPLACLIAKSGYFVMICGTVLRKLIYIARVLNDFVPAIVLNLFLNLNKNSLKFF